MPTFAWVARFRRDFEALDPELQALFLVAVAQFVDDLRDRKSFRKELRVKGVKGAPGIFEMTWADDGRATFEYGNAAIGNEPHVVWRRVGSYAFFKSP